MFPEKSIVWDCYCHYGLYPNVSQKVGAWDHLSQKERERKERERNVAEAMNGTKTQLREEMMESISQRLDFHSPYLSLTCDLWRRCHVENVNNLPQETQFEKTIFHKIHITK